MDWANAVVKAGTMVATFPIEMQASIANTVFGEDDMSTIVTATPSQVGILTHHNKELHHLM